METTNLFPNNQRPVNWQITLKVFIIGAIGLVLLVPKFMILDLIRERQTTAEATTQEVMQKWSLQQTMRGPVLMLPYVNRYSNLAEEAEPEIEHAYVLPKLLKIDAEVMPQKRKRSIYETVVYESEIKCNGYFDGEDFRALKIPAGDILWEKVELIVAIGDLRGITTAVKMNWNDSVFDFSPGMENPLFGNRGISMSMPHFSENDFPGHFQFRLQLKGSEALSFAPVGETTEVVLRSTWDDPGFTGEFLPADYTVNEQGFVANWKVLHFNRNFPQHWKNNEYRATDTDFGVRMVTMADHYQKSTRSAKYAILIVLFVFLAFFLHEIITKQKIHPFQYILVGFALLIFYLLLLSFAEQFGFNRAYLISSLAVVTMILLYSRSFLPSWLAAFLQTLIVVFSFAFVFVLLQLETYALLAGSLGLFAALALTMFFSRKINWYNS